MQSPLSGKVLDRLVFTGLGLSATEPQTLVSHEWSPSWEGTQANVFVTVSSF